MKPLKIKIAQHQKMVITWEDNSVSAISFQTLRKHCPCATCDEERENRGAGYIPLFLVEQVSLVAIEPVGNYGLSLKWKDGHSTGIYEFPFLISLTEEWL